MFKEKVIDLFFIKVEFFYREFLELSDIDYFNMFVIFLILFILNYMLFFMMIFGLGDDIRFRFEFIFYYSGYVKRVNRIRFIDY